MSGWKMRRLTSGAARHHWVGHVHHHGVIRQHRADDAIGDVGIAGTQDPHAASWPRQRVELLRLALAHDVEVDPLAARYRLHTTCVPGHGLDCRRLRRHAGGDNRLEHINGAVDPDRNHTQTQERRIGHQMALILLRDVLASGCTPAFNYGVGLRLVILYALLEQLQHLLRWEVGLLLL